MSDGDTPDGNRPEARRQAGGSVAAFPLRRGRTGPPDVRPSESRDGHAAVKMDEVRRHLDETRFAWIGGTEADSVFYYRVHSPVVLIEFDHQAPIALPNVSREQPIREHVHSIVRTPNGNDYGKDLLRQHYQRHSAPHRH